MSEQALSRLVRQFYAKAQHDPLLGPVFEPAVTDWESHLEQAAAFWVTVTLGVAAYRGNPMAAHGKHVLTPTMFDRWLEIWGETADEVFTPDVANDLKGRAAAIAQSLKSGRGVDPQRARTVAQ